MTSEKRRGARVQVAGAVVDLSDGMRVFSDCEISDISNKGLRINNIPVLFAVRNKLNKQMSLKAVITDNGKVIKIQLSPRWIKGKVNDHHVAVGFEVVNDMGKWMNFIKHKLPTTSDDDVWGNHGRIDRDCQKLVFEYN